MTERKKPSIGCIVGIATVSLAALGLILMIAVSFIGGGSSSGGYAKIAHLDLEGVITSAPQVSWAGTSDSMVSRLKKELKRAREDDSVKAIVLRVNSPGGEVTASDVIYHHVKKAAEKKPLIVYMDSVAASGGFYVACGAKEVYANPTTLTGSIGVIISTLNYEQLFAKLGMESVVFTSGKFKDILSGTRPMREEEQKLIQGMVNQTYERFLGIVMKARPDIPEAKMRNEIADGRILSGADAKELGLINGVGYIEDAYQRAKELANAPNAKVVKYAEEFTLFHAMGLMQNRLLAPPQTPAIELRLPAQPEFQPQPGMLYFLPTLYAP